MTYTDEQKKILQAKTPEKYIETRQGRGNLALSYIEIGYAIHLLNVLYDYKWNFYVTDQQVGTSQVWVKGRLEVDTGTTIIIKEQYGSKDIAKSKADQMPISIGDDLKSAGSDALKKCMSLLGVAEDVYAPNLYGKLSI